LTDTKAAIIHFCNYQERCSKEVKGKLLELGCTAKEIAEYVDELTTIGLLDDARYAKAISRGKFRLLHWGKVKIRHFLQQQQIPSNIIAEGFKEINDDEYRATLRHLMLQKTNELRPKNPPQMMRVKIIRYLIQKGFEQDLVRETMRTVMNDEEI
jgi:regulatory protein